MLKNFALSCLVILACAGSAWGQSVVWVQIKAHPSLRAAQADAEQFAAALDDVNGFALPGGWYGIALGPYRRADADRVLQSYKAQGLIPTDSFIAFSTSFRAQFFPAGTDLLNSGTLDVPEFATAVEQTAVDNATAPQIAQQPSDETPAEARRSEQLLDRQEREDLQTALKWAGFYNAAVDGAFGRGTRRSMSDWQSANGFEPTGVLTTAQRAELFAQYNAVLKGMDLVLVADREVGIEVLIPTGAVRFEAYDYPFARYQPAGVENAQVLLISQEGNAATLNALYDVMETLEIVPLEGPRKRSRNGFTLTGQNDQIVSHTEVGLEGGQIKGFTLIWPAGDDARQLRVLEEIRTSFSRISGVLAPEQSQLNDQAFDLVAGLQVRQPKFTRSGVFVSESGEVLTAAQDLQGCTRLSLEDDVQMQISAADAELGVAVLQTSDAAKPAAIARFAPARPRLKTEAAAAGYSYGGILGAPTVTFGQIADLRGLDGRSNVLRLDMALLDGDTGGPVFDMNGNVTGVVLPKAAGARQLPENVAFAAQSTAVQSFLLVSGIQPVISGNSEPMPPEDVTAQARDVTALITCWD